MLIFLKFSVALSLTNIHQFRADTRYRIEGLPRAMDVRDGWQVSRDSVLISQLDDDDDDDDNDDDEYFGGTRDVIVIVVGKGHGNSSSNPGRGNLHFT